MDCTLQNKMAVFAGNISFISAFEEQNPLQLGHGSIKACMSSRQIRLQRTGKMMQNSMATELQNENKNDSAARAAAAIHGEVAMSHKNGKSPRQNSDDLESPRSVLDGCTTTSDADPDADATDDATSGTAGTTTETTDDTTTAYASCTVGLTAATAMGAVTTTYTEPPTAPAAARQQEVPLWKDAIEAWRSRTKRRLAASMGPTMSSLRSLSIGSSKWRGPAAGHVDEHELCVLRTPFRTFSLSELKKATRNFSKANVVGRGGYAKVYRGSLPDGQLVAVKRLSSTASSSDRVESFLSELGHVVNVRHPNVARLVGVGLEGGEHLVFPFSRLGCLSGRLHGASEEVMPWEARYRVALGAASGIEYLHERCARRIVHRDVKPANILLKDDYEPLICDFGLAKWLPAKMTHYQVATFEGTFGYVPPEYTTHGIFNEKTDVFAFGVVLLELLTGRRAIESKNLSLVAWVRPFLGSEEEIPKMVDPALGGRYDVEQLRRVVCAAELCIRTSPSERPQMSQVTQILRGEETRQQIEEHNRDCDHTDHETNGYDKTRYLDDLSRHKALAFDFEGGSTS